MTAQRTAVVGRFYALALLCAAATAEPTSGHFDMIELVNAAAESYEPAGPPWEYGSTAELDFAVAEAWGSRGSHRQLEVSQRRRLPGGGEGVEDPEILKLHEYVDNIEWHGHVGSTCDDALASGTGEDGSCLYECSALSEYYFPEQDMVRCFMFDEATGSWPAELLDLKRERLDVYTYESTDVDGGIAFTVVRPQVPGVACLLLW